MRFLLCILGILVAAGAAAQTRVQHPAGLPTPSLDCQFAGPVSGTTTIAVGPKCPAITFSRTGSTATHCNAAGAIVTDAANIPRFGYDCQTHAFIGLVVEDTRTNSALNSLAPATQTTGILATGSWSLSIVGPGSVTSSAGTAVGTGFGIATAGSPVAMSLTVTGTVLLTVSGSPTCMQMEAGAFATSCIATTVAATTRNRDIATSPVGLWYSASGGTFIAKAVWPNLPTGLQVSVVQVDDGSNNNRTSIRLNGATMAFGGVMTVGGVATQLGSLTAGVFAEVVQYSSYSFMPLFQQLGQNSQFVQTRPANATTPPGQTILRFGDSAIITGLCNCGILRVRFFPIPVWGSRLQQASQAGQ